MSEEVAIKNRKHKMIDDTSVNSNKKVDRKINFLESNQIPPKY